MKTTTCLLTTSIMLALLTPLEAEPLTIENDLYRVEVDASAGRFSIVSKLSGRTFVTSGGLSANNGSGRITTTDDEHFGRGQSIEVTRSYGVHDSVVLYPGLPFVAFRSRFFAGPEEILCTRISSLSATLDLGKRAEDLRTLGTGGLLTPTRNPGSYAFLAVVDPASRHGVVGAWLTHDRASGVVFSPVENDKVTVKPRLDYGRLLIKPHDEVDTETFLIGYFDDARFGLEAYAEAIAKKYDVTIRPKQPGYCTWYMEKYGQACDETHLAELSAYAAKNLGPWGFGFIQIDDGWQSGIKKNGPRKNFTTYNPEGPYPHGMKSTADMISQLNLTPGTWFMPFAGTWDDPFFKDHQDWFVKTLDGKPYDTAWGGTCLDMSHPEARDYVASVVSSISHEWGYRVFKMDGFWTGSATKQIYVNNGYKEDGIGDAVFFNKDKPNIEVMRDGVKLVREAAGPDVFLLGCCISQNMRSLSGSLGLIDAMRVGPDTGAGTIGYPHASRLWFLNGRVWWNDPDCVSVRASLSLNQARLNATFAAISDTLFYSSDWMPDFPADRLDTLRRCMPGHGLPARPVDVFEHANARIWHVPDTRGPVRRDVIALFNYEQDPARISYDAEAMGLPKAKAYVGFDFWADRFVPPFTKTLTAQLPGHACRVLAIRPTSVNPQLISTSRHVTQGMVDVTHEAWDVSAQTLSAVSRVVGHDPYELRIVVPHGETSWRVKQVTVSPGDRAAGVETAVNQSGARIRVTLTSPTSREVTWAVRFEPAAVNAAVPGPVTQAQARVEYNQITVTWEDQDADLYRVTTQDGEVFETPDRSFVDRGLTRGQVSTYRIEAIGFGGVSTPVVVEAMPMAKLELPPVPPLPTVELSDLELEFVTCGWGTTHLNKNIQGRPLSLAGKVYPKGIGTHATSRINCLIPDEATRFVARVGVDDGKRTSPDTRLVFEVYGDVMEMGEKPVLLARSPELALDTIQDWRFNIELDRRFKMLHLVVDDLGSDKSDWADWVTVGFVVDRSQLGLAAGMSGKGLERIEIAAGWAVKSLALCTSLDTDFLAEAGQADVNKGWLDVGTMPAMVHDILLRHGKIDDPWLPRGLVKCAWVAEQDWVYTVSFPAEPSPREARLCFKGLKAKTDVYLNGDRLATHADSTRALLVDVTGRLRPQNTLVLHVHAPSPRPEGTPAPTRNDRGSYLGPNPSLSTLGVFDRVFLEVTDGTVITEVVADASLDDSLCRGTVTIDVAGTTRVTSAEVKVRLIGPKGGVAASSTVPAVVQAGQLRARSVLTVLHPKLWWPRGYGDPTLYRAEVALLVEGHVHQTETRTLGFRRIDMPEPLHFVVNHVPVFLRGGDWVTPNLLSDVWDPARHDRLLDMAENAHFNAFRIWGQVTPPQYPFYEMADARGFLLWQDFTRLPMNPNARSIATCRAKATELIKRLKHHPSILSWCGINEAAMWAHEDYNKDFTDHGPWPGLAASEAVEAVCRELDPSRYYQPSAPYYGMNPNDPREGTTNGYTNMWFVPGYDYLNFATEDTRIAAPVLHSLQRFMAPEDLWPDGYSTLRLHGNRYPFPATWMPYTTAESWKKTGPVEQFYDAADAAGLVYRLGMAEALYYRDTVERQRRGRPGSEPGDRRCCGGYLVWKYNDSWPQVYSGKVDYFLEPYHAYYALRRAYAPLMLSFDIDTYIYLWAVNDTRTPVTGTVKIQLYHLEKNEFRKEIVRDVTVAPGQSTVVVRLDQAGIRAFRKEHILFATLTDASGQVLARTDALVDIERRLTFPAARLNVQVETDHLVITTDKFARSIHLQGDAKGDPFGWFFEDNYFDLLPGETKEVQILGNHASGRISARPWYSPHTTTVEWKP